MDNYRQIDEPSPTIVGPRPSAGSGGKMSVPQGMERLLVLASIDPAWRKKILADPLDAADEAKIDLAQSEKTIFKSLPGGALQHMISSFSTKNPPSRAPRMAGFGAVAAAALLAGAGRVFSEEPEPAVKGARPKPPAEEPRPADKDAPPIIWVDTLETALAQAKQTNRAVMAVVLHPGQREAAPPVAMAGAMAYRGPSPEESNKVCQTESAEFHKAVKDAQVVAVKLSRPAGQDATESAQAAAFDALTKKYGIANALPTILFLAPDGSLLTQVARPEREAQLLTAIAGLSPLLAKWIAAQVDRQPPPTAQRGVRAVDGIRPDVPKKDGE